MPGLGDHGDPPGAGRHELGQRLDGAGAHEDLVGPVAEIDRDGDHGRPHGRPGRAAGTAPPDDLVDVEQPPAPVLVDDDVGHLAVERLALVLQAVERAVGIVRRAAVGGRRRPDPLGQHGRRRPAATPRGRPGRRRLRSRSRTGASITTPPAAAMTDGSDGVERGSSTARSSNAERGLAVGLEDLAHRAAGAGLDLAVAVDEGQPELRGQPLAHRRLARPHHPDQHDVGVQALAGRPPDVRRPRLRSSSDEVEVGEGLDRVPVQRQVVLDGRRRSGDRRRRPPASGPRRRAPARGRRRGCAPARRPSRRRTCAAPRRPAPAPPSSRPPRPWPARR